jgi:hypothetical protein
MPQTGAGIDKYYCTVVSIGYARAIGKLGFRAHDVSEQQTAQVGIARELKS